MRSGPESDAYAAEPPRYPIKQNLCWDRYNKKNCQYYSILKASNVEYFKISPLGEINGTFIAL